MRKPQPHLYPLVGELLHDGSDRKRLSVVVGGETFPALRGHDGGLEDAVARLDVVHSVEELLAIPFGAVGGQLSVPMEPRAKVGE